VACRYAKPYQRDPHHVGHRLLCVVSAFRVPSLRVVVPGSPAS
jgi:hypothetical protein